MGAITLRNALNVLAKSSSFSVTTVTERKKDEFDKLKEQLFVQQEIESDLQRYLDRAHDGEIIFLCGSSGDGKSEILTRLKAIPHYRERFHFHLDATHSFSPRQSAIEALNHLFSSHAHDTPPLLIGINTGMLANFSREGDDAHDKVKSAIDAFLSSPQGVTRPHRNENCTFFDFERYPKFHFSEDKNYSAFIKSLLENLTRDDDKNLFQFIFRSDEARNPDLKEVANYKLLCMPGVQDVLITQLFKARLIKDQFVNTRTLLDFVHHLLTGPGYLFDNLFKGVENELINKLSEFDPVRIHNYELDQFVLRYELGLIDSELDEFLISLIPLHIRFSRDDIKRGDAASLIRLFWLLKDEDIGNNYHKKFAVFFGEPLLEHYSEIWHLHKNYTGDSEQKKKLNRFYSFELIAGIQRYANRKAPELSMQKEEFFLGEYGGIKVTVPVELMPDWDSILNKNTVYSTGFDVYIKVGEHKIKPVRIGLNLFELIYKLNNGYRPNKYDKNAIVLLEEMIELIAEHAKSSREIKFYDGRHKTYRAKGYGDMITVSGIEG